MSIDKIWDVDFVSCLQVKKDENMIQTTENEMEMDKCIYVLGEKGAGKSTFIADNYQGDEFYKLEFPKGFLKQLKSTGEVEMNLLIKTYNKLLSGMTEAFYDDKTLVIEFCAGTKNDQEYVRLIERSKQVGIVSSLVMITCDEENRLVRATLAEKESGYFSSSLLQPHVIEIYQGFVESVEMSKSMGLVS